MALEDYKDFVGSIAGIATVLNFLSGGVECWKIIKRGRIDGEDSTFFYMGSMIGILMIRYALILNDFTMIIVNIFGISLNVLFFLCYYKYSEEKAALQKKTVKGLIFVISVLLVSFLPWGDSLETVYGLIMTALMFAMVITPLLSINHIIRSKSTKSLPFATLLSGWVVAALWLLYGYIIQNTIVQIQNIIFVFINTLMLSFFVIYPSQPKEITDKKKKK